MIDLKKQLNPSQLDAVTTLNGPILVIAGAGSGKTRVIEYRVLHLVQNQIRPGSILLLTFTRRSSREMLSRASRHDPRCKDVEGGTFHSFALKLLKRYAKRIGFSSSFSILDESDSEEAIHRCAVRLGLLEKDKKRFPRKDTLRSIVSMSVNKNRPVAEILRRDYPHFIDYVPEIVALAKDYVAYKLDKNYMDYDDLLVYLRLLLENEEVNRRLSEEYRYVMVDEYQDTNELQGDITYLLARQNRNVMVVGDDAQSIYGFRGASHENIMAFPERFEACKIVKLEENYRSTQSILDVANAVLENMRNKYSKCLISAKKEAGDRPGLLFFKEAYEEAGWIADKILGFRNRNISLSRQGILFRSAYVSIPLQAELSKRNIPYQVYGGLKFYETAHVKDVMAHLKVLANPKDELAWTRILLLIEGIGPKSAERILQEILGRSGFREMVEEGLQKFIKGREGSSQGLVHLGSLLRAACEEGLTVGERFEQVAEYYTPFLKNKFDDWPLRANDLEALKQIASRYEELGELLADFAIEPPERGVWRTEPSVPEDEGPLTLSTIHSAKGLEWDVVFMIALADGILPVSFALNDEEGIEEENRLFYVGVTRAKRRLFLTLHHEGERGGLTQFNKISRFIDLPNILSKLEKAEEKEEPPIYDKGSLFERGTRYLVQNEEET